MIPPKNILLTLCFSLFIGFSSFSQKTKIKESDYLNTEVEMADQLRSDGKIYVVVAVITTILLGLFVYVMTIDRKISRLEKEVGPKVGKI